MTIREALERLIFNELECGETVCRDCQYHDPSTNDCCLGLISAAQTVKEWLDKMPEDALPNVTIADLL